MNPTISFLVISSIIISWIITKIGLPPQVWTRFAVPCLSAWCLCEHDKLRRAVDVQLSRLPTIWDATVGMSIGVLVVALLYSRWLSWNLIIPLFCFFSLVTAFSFEKMMYMGSYCGERAKWVCWLAAGSFATETFRMNWKGDWAYCSPYSRRLQRKDVDFYYSLKLPEKHEARIPEPFYLEFIVEKCKIKCKYSDCDETLGSPESSSHSARRAVSIEEGSQEADQERQVAGARPKNRPSSSGTAGGSRAETDGSTSSQPENSTQDRYIFGKQQVSKLEVSLFMVQGDEEVPLECYTYFQREPDGVVEMKRAMEVLKDEGNVIFSSFYRNVGSGVLKAHAKCYEFAEMCDLILNHGCKLHKIRLLGTHECYISGSVVLAFITVAIFLWINYRQLSGIPRPELISLLVISGLLQLEPFKLFSPGSMGKRLVFLLISFTTEPHQLDMVYRYFQAKLPFLTFCNESYGYPLHQNRRSICSFPDMRLPLTDISGQPRPLRLELPLGRTLRLRNFDLKTMHLELTVRGTEREGEFEVKVLMTRKYDGVFIYYNIFRINEERKVANLVALLRWLVDNNCVGICKDWPRRTLMHAYRYEELLCKVLQEGAQPWIIYWSQSIDVCVEGLLV